MAHRRIIFVSLPLIFLSACASVPSSSSTSTQAPAWTQQPTRVLDGDSLVYVGIGEDRNRQNTRPKALAFALQDLANECSVLPRGTEAQEYYDDTLGILFRSYAKIVVSLQDCQRAKAAQTVAQIQSTADAALSAQVKQYQQTYDAPEHDESAPLGNTGTIQDSAHLFIVRQQLTLTKQEIALTPNPLPRAQAIASATHSIANFEQAHPEIEKSSLAFSANRPNAPDHQPLAVKDTIAERARIKSEYPDMPLPPTRAGKGSKGGGRKGRRGQGQQQQQQPDGSNGNPPAAPGM